MISLIPDLPEAVVGFAATGEVNGNDYEAVLMPAVEKILTTHKKARILCQFGPELTGFSAAAIWDDAKLGVAHFNAWEKIAIITDRKWLKSAIGIIHFVMPCPLKVFYNEQYSEAKNWVEL